MLCFGSTWHKNKGKHSLLPKLIKRSSEPVMKRQSIIVKEKNKPRDLRLLNIICSSLSTGVPRSRTKDILDKVTSQLSIFWSNNSEELNANKLALYIFTYLNIHIAYVFINTFFFNFFHNSSIDFICHIYYILSIINGEICGNIGCRGEISSEISLSLSSNCSYVLPPSFRRPPPPPRPPRKWRWKNHP